jgi:hypothetical protein
VGITGLARLAAKLLIMGALARSEQGVGAAVETPRPTQETRPAQSGPVHKGIAAHYDIGAMEGVAYTRKLPIVRCMISSPFHGIGAWYRITSLVTGKTLDCRVTDVSAPEDEARHRRKSQLELELDFASAKFICGIDSSRKS